jgi:colicin import membrane protein
LHILVLAFLMFELSFPVKSSGGASSSTPVIQAVAVSQQVLDNYENQVQAAREAVIREQQRQQEIAREKILQQQALERQQQLKQLEAQRQAAEMARQKIAAAQAAAAQKAAAQKAAVAKAQKRAAQQAEKKMLQKALAQDMQKELATDQHALSQSHQQSASSSSRPSPSPSSSPQNQGVIDKYKALIVQAISSQWIVPPDLAQNISCELDIRLAPGGVVLQVSIARSSGNTVLDNSAVAAVNKASPLPVPTEPGMFNQFRERQARRFYDGSMRR